MTAVNNVSFFDPKKEKQVERQRLLAQMLTKQGQTQLGKGNEIVSGQVVKKSPIEGLAGALQMGLGGMAEGRAGQAEDEVAAQRQQLMAQAIEQLGTDPKAAAGTLMQDPQNLAAGLGLYKSAMDSETATANQAQEWAREDSKWEKDAALKRELAAGRSGGSGQVIGQDADGNPIYSEYSNKPLPVGALKLQQEGIDALAAAKSISETSGLLSQQVDTGTLDVGPVKNLVSEVRNFIGKSTPESLAYANLDTALEKIRNDSLRLNKGVQTEGDAVRAMNEVIKNKNDPKLLQSSLQKLEAINDRAAELQKVQVNTIRQNYNAAPMDFENVNALPSPIQEGYRPQAPSGGADAIRAKLQGKMPPERIEAYIKSKGLQ